jgi:hypothetical protein
VSARRRLAVVPALDLTALEDDFLWCRTERHWWKWQRDSLAEEEDAFDRTLACARCGAEKTKTISTTTFQITKHHSPRYPAGYLIKGSGRIPVSEVYREQYGRRTAPRRRSS